MSLLRSLSEGLRALFRKERVEAELDEELRGFLEMAVKEKMQQGMSRKEMRFAPCAWNGAVSKLRRKPSALPVGNVSWRCGGKICASPPACSASLPVSPLLLC